MNENIVPSLETRQNMGDSSIEFLLVVTRSIFHRDIFDRQIRGKPTIWLTMC
ncbi:hypothetical protein SAMN05216388_10285 [Halorientalis persicus]|uniref:Uncharacterized protein n=1 Tax=Halorientalis persicus TaxID=1367881 RepID=A0A1H8UK35_9EURY|nr:hypothetical protein SAMN05216388_10285 [Halorientalis persicus]